MATHETKFGQYRVTLDTDMDGEDSGVTGCWIEFLTYSASLEALRATGVLEGCMGEHEVPKATISDIEAWAERNGY